MQRKKGTFYISPLGTLILRQKCVASYWMKVPINYIVEVLIKRHGTAYTLLQAVRYPDIAHSPSHISQHVTDIWHPPMGGMFIKGVWGGHKPTV